MNKFASYTLLIALAFFSACSTDSNDIGGDLIVNEFSSNPVFTFNAKSGSETTSIQAGVDLFYMFAEYEIDDSDVYSFIARFSKLSTCTETCAESLSIKIRDFQAVTNIEDLAVENALTQGTYNFSFTNDLDFSAISVTYTNSDGLVFESQLADQGPSSFFEILSVEDYNENEVGNPTKILVIRFQCDLLEAGNNTAMRFTDGEATIAVAYPR